MGGKGNKGRQFRFSLRRTKDDDESDFHRYSGPVVFQRYASVAEDQEKSAVESEQSLDCSNDQGHPTNLFLTISVLQRKFCWLGTEVSAVLLGSGVLNLRSRIYEMYQKFLLEVFYPSNLLEIYLGCMSSCVSEVIGSSLCANCEH